MVGDWIRAQHAVTIAQREADEKTKPTLPVVLLMPVQVHSERPALVAFYQRLGLQLLEVLTKQPGYYVSTAHGVMQGYGWTTELPARRAF